MAFTDNRDFSKSSIWKKLIKMFQPIVRIKAMKDYCRLLSWFFERNSGEEGDKGLLDKISPFCWNAVREKSVHSLEIRPASGRRLRDRPVVVRLAGARRRRHRDVLISTKDPRAPLNASARCINSTHARWCISATRRTLLDCQIPVKNNGSN